MISVQFNKLIGINLKNIHYNQILNEKPDIGWIEFHSENFFCNNEAFTFLSNIAQLYPISFHGVGLSLGSVNGINKKHLMHLRRLSLEFNPVFVSEHLSWSFLDDIYLPDLLPIPYTKESMEIFIKNLDIAQNYLKREILIENPSSYIEYKDSQFQEWEFLTAICRQSGAKILLDVNNLFVSSFNHHWNAYHYINSIPKDLVKEIHIAGHIEQKITQHNAIRIDTHSKKVCTKVWDLYSFAIKKFGNLPTLLEWDQDIPSLHTLITEAKKALYYISSNDAIT
ncbi:MAG: DUF692 domain-containing protein [Proteobacteria bacterium]|nr:DUF692 domain-containing protein [Pseudomonadota bacterium]